MMNQKTFCATVSVLKLFTSAFLWQGEIAAEFDESKLEAVLEAIPEDLRSKDLCPWFRTVLVPFVRRVVPTGEVGNILSSLKHWHPHHIVQCFH